MGLKYRVSFENCSNLYTRRINTDLLSLRAILTAIEDGTYNNHEIWHTGGVDYAVGKVKLNDELRTYEVVKTFISVMRSTNDYLDRLISIINFTQKPHWLPKTVIPENQSEYLQHMIDQELVAYCKKGEHFPTKLAKFVGLPERFRKCLEAYNTLRNCYEHRKMIASATMTIPLYPLTLEVDGKPFKLGGVVQERQLVSISYKEKVLSIKDGEVAAIAYEDLESIVMFLQYLPENITKVAVEMIKKTAVVEPKP